MNKITCTPIIIALTIIALFLAVCNVHQHQIIKKQLKVIKEKRATINKCLDAFAIADCIFDNEGIWDKDGSDNMSEYLNLRKEIHSDATYKAIIQYNTK